MNMQLLKEFVCLETRKRELEAELKTIRVRIDDLEQVLVPQFLADGVASVKVDGRTVYIAQDIQAGPLNDRSEVIAALRSSELGRYISENYDTRSLRALVREVAAEVRLRCQQQDLLFSEEEVRGALPSPLRNALRISFVQSIRSKKA